MSKRKKQTRGDFMILTKRIYENLLLIREIKRAAGGDTTELDAKIEKILAELQNKGIIYLTP